MPKYRVKQGERVHHGREGEKPRRYQGGDIIELEVAEAEAMPHAVEPVGKKDEK